jgi:uncharacterized protein (TIGR00369 family)
VSELPAIASRLDGELGLVFESAQDGVAILRLDPTPLAVVDDDDPPYLHGGTLTTCIDTASWYAVTSAAGGVWLVSGLHLDALRLARPEPHRVTARNVKVGRTLAVVDVEIAPADDLDRVVAVGRATLARVGPSTGR